MLVEQKCLHQVEDAIMLVKIDISNIFEHEEQYENFCKVLISTFRGGMSRENLCPVGYWVRQLNSGPGRVFRMRVGETHNIFRLV